MNFKNKKQGFTLLELLVVIAIIAVLASIIAIWISDSQEKSKNSKIQSQMANLRRVTEVYYVSNNNSYGATTSSCSSGMYTDTTHEVANFVSTSNYPATTTLACYASTSAWAVSASLFGGGYWCVDTSGQQREISSHTTSTTCPSS